MKTFIFGASGHAREVFWIIDEINKRSTDKIIVEKFVVADDDVLLGSNYNSIDIISESDYSNTYSNQSHNCILAVGSPKTRRNIYNKINSENTFFPTLVHPSVICDKSTITLNKGVIIAPNVTLTTNVAIHDFVHINIGSTVSHDVVINAFSTISPAVHIAGKVTLGENVFLGINAVVIEELSICSDAIIGAGAIVTKSIKEKGTYVGIPALKKK